eukprot:6629037-Pyramimonas_sp.AAC.1
MKAIQEQASMQAIRDREIAENDLNTRLAGAIEATVEELAEVGKMAKEVVEGMATPMDSGGFFLPTEGPDGDGVAPSCELHTGGRASRNHLLFAKVPWASSFRALR